MIRLRVKEIAEAQGLNISQLSRRTDVEVKTIRAIFHDPYKVVMTDTLDRLANGLKVHVYDLIEYTPNEQ